MGPDEAIRKGDHNAISIFIVKLVSKTTVPKIIAPFYAEFYGTMMLTLVIAVSAGLGKELAPLAIGLMLVCMVFTYGHLSGGHFNPAVSFAVMIRGKITPLRCLLYTIFQVLGGICGVALGRYVLPEGQNTPVPKYQENELNAAITAEFFFSMALSTVVLNTATTVSVGPNSFYGLAIGFVVVSGAICVGDISGAVFNPAVGTGLLIVAGEVRDLWLYWVAPLCGGFVSGVMFHIVNSDENDITFGKVTEINVEGAAVGAHVSRKSMRIVDDALAKDVLGRSILLNSVPE